MFKKRRLLIALMKGGRSPAEKDAIRVTNIVFPKRDNLHVTFVAGPTWADPAKVIEIIGRRTVVAVIYNVDGESFIDRVYGKRLKRLQQMLTEAAPGESSWDVAMRMHDAELHRT